MLKWTVRALVVSALTLSAMTCPAVGQEPEKISMLNVVGCRRVDSDTVLSLIHTQVDGPYDPKTLLQDVERLEHSKYFQDVYLGVDDSPNTPNAKIVTFRLIERPVIDSIEYNGLGSVRPSDIVDRFKTRGVDLVVGGFFNLAVLSDAQVAIREVLAEHGNSAAQVKFSFESVRGRNAVNLTFTVTEGPAKSH